MSEIGDRTGSTMGDHFGPPTEEHRLIPEITYDEHLYPARPRRLRPSARRVLRDIIRSGLSGATDGSNDTYVKWLVEQSMLHDAQALATQLSGQGSMWQNPFADPDPRAAVERAAVWFTAYPLSFITRSGASFLAGLAEPELWQAFQEIGIDAMHTGPVKLAGGINGWSLTGSVDGHFDRISMQVDAMFGTEDQFRALCVVAGEHDGTVIDDIVPGHTGKGADFRLAEMGYQDYPGIYHMVSIDPQDWHMLPDVPDGRDYANLDVESEAKLQAAGYIIGKLQRVIFYEPGVKETNWSATRVVKGVDGVERRWVYLHYFKAGQPSINWLDPSFAGMRLVIGDALHSLADLGSGALRLDANGFLGVEKSAEDRPAWSEGHPLSEAANQLISSMVRKMGGFSFQELNLTMDDIKTMAESGADLSYDFVNRPAYHHALAMGDTEFLRLTMNQALALGIDSASLVHALQNHDELTHELVHFATRHRDDAFTYGGQELTGGELAIRVRGELTAALTGPDKRYNLPFTTNGIACTTASAISAILGIADPGSDVRRGRRAGQAHAPPAGDVQRLPAGRLRPLGLGPDRDAHDRSHPGGRPHLRGRHALDQPRCARPHGRQPPRAALRGWVATRHEPVRHPARAARRPLLVRAPVAPHHSHPPPLSHPHGHSDRRAGGVAPVAAGDGAPPGERQPPGDRAQLWP